MCTEANTPSISDSDTKGGDVVQQGPKLVKTGECCTLVLQGEAVGGEVRGFNRSPGGEGNNRQKGEDPLEIEGVRLREGVAEQMQAQIRVSG